MPLEYGRRRIRYEWSWKEVDVGQLVQVLGALLILLPFALAQFNLLGQHHWLYLAGNAVGSGILLGIALVQVQWGFVLLESTWAAVSLWGLAGLVRGGTRLANRGNMAQAGRC